MQIDTEVIANEVLKLQEKYGREVVIKAERMAIKEIQGFRPMTEMWVTMFLRKRRNFAATIAAQESSSEGGGA